MSTVPGVLRWLGAATRPPSAEFAPLLAEYAKHHPKAETTLIEAAFAVAEEAHRGQNRKSGEPYIRHPVAVATVVARQGLDDISIAAALLHDAVEDTVVGLEELAREFSAELAGIVDGVTKLDRVHYDSKEEQQAATMRKMIVAIAQ
ncbi:MAG: HD domain-containing protein, partial [Actinomycetota bacterium]|nr:HD domain-containing protein [Actinomycetota bacterium]